MQCLSQEYAELEPVVKCFNDYRQVLDDIDEAKTLIEEGAKLIFTAQNEKNLEQVKKLFPEAPAFLLDVEKEDQIRLLQGELKENNVELDGWLHSIAFAQFSLDEQGHPRKFYETETQHFLQATQISCFSLATVTNALKPFLRNDASIVAISISDTKATSYGYLGPIKAALNSTVGYLAKSLSEDSHIRVNAVCAGPLKTSASAGIPNYIENYLFAEQKTLRKQALKTQEVADTVAFLLSPRSSGLNASEIVVDAGMQVNHFDQELVKAFGEKI